MRKVIEMSSGPFGFLSDITKKCDARSARAEQDKRDKVFQEDRKEFYKARAKDALKASEGNKLQAAKIRKRYFGGN